MSLAPARAVARVPVRLGVPGLIGLALLAGLAYAECVGRLRARQVQAALLLVLATTMWADGLGPWSAIHGRRPRPLAYPLAESVSPDGAIIRRLQESGGPLLELPIGRGGREEPRPQARAMYRSIFHWRPL